MEKTNMAKEKRPTQEEMLWRVHGLLVQRFLEILQGDKPVRGSTLAIIVDFLKMNDTRLTGKDSMSRTEAKAYLEDMATDKLPFA